MTPNSVCTVSTIKASLKITLAFVHYHLNIGVDHMYLYFDDPEDPAIEVLKEYKRVSCFDGNKVGWRGSWGLRKMTFNFKQNRNATKAFKIAKKVGFKWIFHIDSDELIYTKIPLKEFLSGIPKDVQTLCFNNLEAVPNALSAPNGFHDISLFKNQPIKLVEGKGQKEVALLDERDENKYEETHQEFINKKEQAIQMGCTKPFEPMYYNGYKSGKSITKTNAPIVLLRNHFPQLKKGKLLKSIFVSHGWILHFDGWTFSSWYDKWERVCNQYRNGWKAGPKRKEQMDTFLKMYSAKDIEGLRVYYKKLHFVDKKDEQILLKLDMLEEIKLDEKLFKKPKE